VDVRELKTTSFNDVKPITEYTFKIYGSSWLNLNKPEMLYQWADTGDLNNVYDINLPFDFYGAMYNHLAIESGKLAPKGWKIPSVQDFKELENYLVTNGYTRKEAETLKTATGWIPSSENGTNAIGFNALPNGYINAFCSPKLAGGITT
jgi:uncharacterized protein (TIGR02145 family)